MDPWLRTFGLDIEYFKHIVISNLIALLLLLLALSCLGEFHLNYLIEMFFFIVMKKLSCLLSDFSSNVIFLQSHKLNSRGLNRIDRKYENICKGKYSIFMNGITHDSYFQDCLNYECPLYILLNGRSGTRNLFDLMNATTQPLWKIFLSFSFH